jgi:hypothetical protein
MTSEAPPITEPKRRGRPPKAIAEGHENGRALSEDLAGPTEGVAEPEAELDVPDDHAQEDPAPNAAPEETRPQERPPQPELAEPWQSMDTAPLGGKPVWLLGMLTLPCGLGVPITQAAFRYNTRRRERAPMRWVETAWWAGLNTARTPVPFEPIGWTRYQ